MSQGNFNAPPPPKSGGMSTLTIVLIVFGILGLICVGACGVCSYSAYNAAKGFGGMVFAETAMTFVKEDEEVKAELGEPLTQENASFQTSGNSVVVDFDVKGPNGTGKGHAEFSAAEPNVPPGTAPKAGVITVKLPSGKTVNISTEPKFETGNEDPTMPDDSDDAAGTPSDSFGIPDDSTGTPADSSGTPGDSSEM